eukprot:317225_1
MGFQFCMEYTPLRWFYLLLCIVATFGVYFLVMYGIKHTYSLPLSWKLQILYYVNCFSFFWGATGYMIFEILSYSPYYCKIPNLQWHIVIAGGYCGYLLGLVALYAMLVERLRISFKGSSLAVSKPTYYILSFGIIIQFILVWSGAILYYENTENMDGHDWPLINGLCFVTVNGFFGILLLYIFVRKTYILAQKTMNITRSASITQNVSTTSIESGSCSIQIQKIFRHQRI